MLKEKSRKIIIALLWTAMTVVLFFWNNASFQFSYYFAEQLRMFEWDSTYAWSTLLQPMGLVIYGADFLTQFYHLPYMGALVAAFIFLVLSLGFRGLCYRQGVSPLYAGLAFLPGIVLTILGENQFYHLENSLAMVNVVLLLNLYIRIRGQWWRATLLVLGSWLLYYTSGAGFLFFLLLAHCLLKLNGLMRALVADTAAAVGNLIRNSGPEKDDEVQNGDERSHPAHQITPHQAGEN